MAKPQLEDGHTRIANEILEHLSMMHLSANQWQVLIHIIRKTYGYHKKVDHIANSQICEGTRLCKAVVSRVLHDLEDLQLITRKGKEMGIQKNWENWKGLAVQSTSDTKLAEQSTNESLQFSQPKLAISSSRLAIQQTKVSSAEPENSALKIKDTITKDTIQKKEKFVLPDWIDKDTWEAFLEMRKVKKAISTQYALSLIVKNLERFKSSGDDPNEVLKMSIMNSWKGVFPLKGGQDGANRKYNRQRQLPKTYRTPEEIFGRDDD